MAESRSAGGIAEGTIRPMRFVKIGSDDGDVLECDAGDRPIGISFKGTRRSDYVSDDGAAANAGEPISYYTVSARCFLTIAGTVTAGTRLKSDNDGKGVAVSADADFWGAIAERDGVAGEHIPVTVFIGQAAA